MPLEEVNSSSLTSYDAFYSDLPWFSVFLTLDVSQLALHKVSQSFGEYFRIDPSNQMCHLELRLLTAH